MNIAVLASGSGSNFEAIARAVNRGYIKSRIKLLLTDKKNAFVRQRARKFNIKDIFVSPTRYPSRLAFDKVVVRILRKEKIDLVVLAGYMRILSPYFVRCFKNKILNIHPAILPAFKGTAAIEDAFSYGCRVTGVTVHFVDEKVDHGPIILQEAIKINQDMTAKTLEQRIHALEHKLYPLAVKLFTEKRLNIKKRHVQIA